MERFDPCGTESCKQRCNSYGIWCEEICVDEIERLRAELDDYAALLSGPVHMDPPDGGDVTVLEQMRRMAEDAKRYRLLRLMHWASSPMAVVVLPKQAVRLGYDCPCEERLDEMLDEMLLERSQE